MLTQNIKRPYGQRFIIQLTRQNGVQCGLAFDGWHVRSVGPVVLHFWGLQSVSPDQHRPNQYPNPNCLCKPPRAGRLESLRFQPFGVVRGPMIHGEWQWAGLLHFLTKVREKIFRLGPCARPRRGCFADQHLNIRGRSGVCK